MRELGGIRILEPSDGAIRDGNRSTVRELISRDDTNGRWRFGEVVAEADDVDDEVSTHLHPGEPEAIIVLEGRLELHGATGMTEVGPGDVLFIPPDTEHGLRTPTGGRWLAIWPVGERVQVRPAPE
jgi:mannose-6-phosphate isomerase-like protein (cupin superfamily)